MILPGWQILIKLDAVGFLPILSRETILRSAQVSTAVSEEVTVFGLVEVGGSKGRKLFPVLMNPRAFAAIDGDLPL